MQGHEAVCRDCDWRKLVPERELAEHAKRVHETEHGHTVVIERG